DKMFQTLVNANRGRKRNSGFFHLEPGLLGGFTVSTNQTRVMTANRLSRFVRPADLDAFLRGYFNGN
ncbi:MAG: hypothetical protein V1742_09650, partial [Pseudomonadota bacterium]